MHRFGSLSRHREAFCRGGSGNPWPGLDEGSCLSYLLVLFIPAHKVVAYVYGLGAICLLYGEPCPNSELFPFTLTRGISVGMLRVTSHTTSSSSDWWTTTRNGTTDTQNPDMTVLNHFKNSLSRRGTNTPGSLKHGGIREFLDTLTTAPSGATRHLSEVPEMATARATA